MVEEFYFKEVKVSDRVAQKFEEIQQKLKAGESVLLTEIIQDYPGMEVRWLIGRLQETFPSIRIFC